MIRQANALGWRELLTSLRTARHAWTGKYDIRPYWRELAFLEHAGAPLPVQWAQTFAAVLDHMELHTCHGEAILGSRLGFMARQLPEGQDQAGFTALVEANSRRRRRDFGAGWDHTLADYPTLLAEGVGGLLARI